MLLALVLLFAAPPSAHPVCVDVHTIESDGRPQALPGLTVTMKDFTGIPQKTVTDERGIACFASMQAHTSVHFHLDGSGITQDGDLDWCTATDGAHAQMEVFVPPEGLVSDCTSMPGRERGFDISGIVETATGCRITRARILLLDAHSGEWWTTTTDRHGRFRFSRIPFGSFDLRVRRAGLTPQTLHFREGLCEGGPRHLVVQLRPPCE